MSWFSRLGIAPKEKADAQTLREISGALEELEPERARHVALFAFILSRVANADLDISADETHAMEQLVAEWAELPEPQAVLVVEIAKSQNRIFGSTDNFLATREFKKNASREQKHKLLHCLFAVSAADDEISNDEEHVVKQVATELGLTNKEYVGIRAAYKDKRSVFNA